MPDNHGVFCVMLVSAVQGCWTERPRLKQLRSGLCLQRCRVVSFLSLLRKFLFERGRTLLKLLGVRCIQKESPKYHPEWL